jgi:hypothetical protein
MAEYVKLLEDLYLYIEDVLKNHEEGLTITQLIDRVWEKVRENGDLRKVKNKQSIRDAVISMAKDGKVYIEYREPKTLFIKIINPKTF